MSIKSLRIYILINAILMGLGLALHFFNTCFPSFVTMGFILKNSSLTSFLLVITSKKLWISTRHNAISSTQFLFEIFRFSLTESILFALLYSGRDVSPEYSMTVILIRLKYFVVKSFIYELVFDFIYYWIHRLLHKFPTLYKYIHKKHHNYNKPTIESTFHENIFENLIANVFPSTFTIFLLKTFLDIHFAPSEFCCLSVYKTFVEISGHCGRDLRNSSSFPQFIWLPKLLGIH